jgi:hypothetical protein
MHGASDQLDALGLRDALSTEQPDPGCGTDDARPEQTQDKDDQGRGPTCSLTVSESAARLGEARMAARTARYYHAAFGTLPYSTHRVKLSKPGSFLAAFDIRRSTGL